MRNRASPVRKTNSFLNYGHYKRNPGSTFCKNDSGQKYGLCIRNTGSPFSQKLFCFKIRPPHSSPGGFFCLGQTAKSAAMATHNAFCFIIYKEQILDHALQVSELPGLECSACTAFTACLAGRQQIQPVIHMIGPQIL